MTTRQENRGDIGFDPDEGHIAATGTKAFDLITAQFEAFAAIQSAKLGIPPEKVTMVDFLNSLKADPTTEKK